MTASGDALISTSAHDLKGPLETIVMGASLLMGAAPGDSARVRSLAEVILRSAERVSSMIDDLRDLALLESGSFDLQLDAHDAEQLARDAMERRLPDAKRRGVSVELHGPPGIMVRVDRDQVVRALSKLLDNAIRFSASGGRVRILIERAEAVVLFSVADGGRGIAAPLHKELFERDSRGDTRWRDGPGLSLPLVKRIVEMQGGRITVASAPGEGTTLSFTAPVA